MKKFFALLLVVCMLAAVFTGCGAENDTPTQADKTQNEQQEHITDGKSEVDQGEKEAAVGTILDAPESLFDANTEELYIYYTYPGDTPDEVKSMELALNQVTEDTYILYVTDGLLKNHELVYEVTSTGVTKYYKDIFMEAFELETEATQEQLVQEKNDMLSMISLFIMEHPDYDGLKYKKSDAIVAALTGEVYVYELIENNEYAGQIAIDKATGIMVSLKDAQGSSVFTVFELATANVEIPAYK